MLAAWRYFKMRHASWLHLKQSRRCEVRGINAAMNPSRALFAIWYYRASMPSAGEGQRSF